jgi:hypothetical protein
VAQKTYEQLGEFWTGTLRLASGLLIGKTRKFNSVQQCTELSDGTAASLTASTGGCGKTPSNSWLRCLITMKLSLTFPMLMSEIIPNKDKFQNKYLTLYSLNKYMTFILLKRVYLRANALSHITILLIYTNIFSMSPISSQKRISSIYFYKIQTVSSSLLTSLL